MRMAAIALAASMVPAAAGAEWLAPEAAALVASVAAASTGDEPGTPDFAVEESAPPFDPSPVVVDPGLRFEARAGLWLVESASRLRTSGPSAGIGLSARMGDRLRVDGGYLFTWAQLGTRALNVLNTYHALHARLHYVWQVGGASLTAGAGPVGYLVSSAASVEGQVTDSNVLVAGGGQLALGAETEVDGRLVRFELAGASRSRRVDLHLAMIVGF